MPQVPPKPSPPGSNTKNTVGIYINNSGIHDIVGPTPFITLDRQLNRTNTGALESITTTINLEGKIVKTTGTPSGISAVFGAIQQLKDLISKCDTGVLDIKCNSNLLAQFSGIRVVSFNANRSEDNWVFTADYSIQIEVVEPGKSGEPPVTNTSDSWSIEPIEDYLYLSWNSGVQKNAEGPENTKIANLGGSSFKFTNIPQFRISHRVSAVGLNSSGIPQNNSSSNNNTICPSGLDPNKAYLNAKKWVESRLAFPFAGSGAYILGPTSAGGGGGTSAMPFGRSVFLYNHLRSINFSITEGSYEVNDNWLALSSGVRYVEDFNIESSTSENYTTTVRIQGTVRGLETEQTGLLHTGLTPDDSGVLGLSYATGCAIGGLTSAGGGGGTSGPPAGIGSLKCYKYENALEGWLNDIKPTLYTRACSIVNSFDRTKDYINPAQSNPPAPPINPVFAKQTLLNVIPVSTTEGHSLLNGTVSYSYEFNNKLNAISGTISQNISITDDAPADVIAETFVVGRELGPILQKMGKSSARKSVTVEVVVVPPSSIGHYPQTAQQCPLYTGGYVYQTIDCIIEGLKPFGDRVCSVWPQTRSNLPGQVFLNNDTRNWSPSEGRYSRSVSWTYQRCTQGNFMDH